METKVCTKCGIEKDISEFNIIKGYRRRSCKVCMNKRKSELTLYHKIQNDETHQKKKITNKKSRIKHLEKYREYKREYAKKYALKYPERVKKKWDLYVRNNPEKIKIKNTIQKKVYVEKNKDKVKYWQHKCMRNGIDNLTDYYIAKILRLNKSNIHPYPEFIESKRVEIKLKRLIKTKKNENNETS
jgi:hypothetical protein